MASRETESIVLRTTDFGESDRLVTFYTRAAGKLKGVARGARRSRKRFVHAFEAGSRVELACRDGKSLAWIEACKLLDAHLELRMDIHRWAYGAVALEIMDRMTPEGDAQEDLFELLAGVLEHLGRDSDPENAMVLFLVGFLAKSGYLPAWSGCAVCGLPAEGSISWWWDLAQGRLACPQHRGGGSPLALDLGTLKLMDQVRRRPSRRIWRLHLRRERKAPMLNALLDWIRTQIHRDLNSMAILRQIRESAGSPVAPIRKRS